MTAVRKPEWDERASRPLPVKKALRLDRRARDHGVRLISLSARQGTADSVTMVYPSRVIKIYDDGAMVQQIVQEMGRADPHWLAHRERFHASALKWAAQDRKFGFYKTARINVKLARDERELAKWD